MALDIGSLVRRYMRQTSAFVPAEPTNTVPVNVGLDVGEEFIGWYTNPPPWTRVILVFTTRAIIICENSLVMRIPFDEIVDFKMPASVAEATGLRIRIRDGFRFVRMAGAYRPENKFKDVFSLTRLLQVITR